MASLYMVQNGAMVTTAPFVGVTTSATLYTLLQIVPAASAPLKVVEWGVSFNGSAAATPFNCELIETGTVAATVTAFVAADVMPFGDPNSPTQTAGTSGIPLNMGTALSGYTSSAEGSASTTRLFDGQFIAPANQYWKQFPLGREPLVKPGNVCRVRVKGDGATKAQVYVIFEV
jgi:hypothetical protein